MGIGCISPAKKRKMAASILRKSPAKNGGITLDLNFGNDAIPFVDATVTVEMRFCAADHPLKLIPSKSQSELRFKWHLGR